MLFGGQANSIKYMSQADLWQYIVYARSQFLLSYDSGPTKIERDAAHRREWVQ